MKKKNGNTGTQPNRKIKAVVDMIFDDIPYSEEVNEAQSKIEAALNTEFDKIKAGRHEDEALEELLGHYGSLSQMAVLAGYPAESADKWRREGEAVDIRPLKKEIRRQRIGGMFLYLFILQSHHLGWHPQELLHRMKNPRPMDHFQFPAQYMYRECWDVLRRLRSP